MVSGDRLPDLLTTIYFYPSVVPLRKRWPRDPIRVSNTTY